MELDHYYLLDLKILYSKFIHLIIVTTIIIIAKISLHFNISVKKNITYI